MQPTWYCYWRQSWHKSNTGLGQGDLFLFYSPVHHHRSQAAKACCPPCWHRGGAIATTSSGLLRGKNGGLGPCSVRRKLKTKPAWEDSSSSTETAWKSSQGSSEGNPMFSLGLWCKLERTSWGCPYHEVGLSALEQSVVSSPSPSAECSGSERLHPHPSSSL